MTKKKKCTYRTVLCKGVKVCGQKDEGCSYVVSTRETRHCQQHQDTPLVLSSECGVEFAYICPVDTNDHRRWLLGILCMGEMTEMNLHNHPSHAPSKIPAKVEADIKAAVIADPTLKADDLLIGT